MKLKTILKLTIYTFAEVGLSIPIIHGFETGNAIEWFCFSVFLILFNGAILSLGEYKNIINWR